MSNQAQIKSPTKFIIEHLIRGKSRLGNWIWKNWGKRLFCGLFLYLIIDGLYKDNEKNC
jgi:hypothetical protein